MDQLKKVLPSPREVAETIVAVYFVGAFFPSNFSGDNFWLLLSYIAASFVLAGGLFVFLKCFLFYLDVTNNTGIVKRKLRDYKLFNGLILVVGYSASIAVAYGDTWVISYSMIVSSGIVMVLLLQVPMELKTCEDKTFSINNITFLVHLLIMIAGFVLNCVYRPSVDAELISICHLFTFFFYGAFAVLNLVNFYVHEASVVNFITQKCLKEKLIRSATTECQICLLEHNDSDRTPRILTGCGHTVCHNCAQELFELSSPLRCPFCRTVTNETKADLLEKNEVVLERIKLHEKSKKSMLVTIV